jgi:hypothetical protein
MANVLGMSGLAGDFFQAIIQALKLGVGVTSAIAKRGASITPMMTANLILHKADNRSPLGWFARL